MAAAELLARKAQQDQLEQLVLRVLQDQLALPELPEQLVPRERKEIKDHRVYKVSRVQHRVCPVSL